MKKVSRARDEHTPVAGGFSPGGREVVDMSALKALLFDLDGTLTHSDPVHFLAFKQLMAEEGLKIDEEGYRRHISGRSNAELGLRLFPERSVDEHVLLLARKEALFREFAVELTPVTGLSGLFNRARDHSMRLGLVTNAPRENVSHMLTAIAASEWFDTIVYGDEMVRPKPDPLPYLMGLERLGVTASEALAFEDSVPGIQAAKAAGIFTIGITTSRTPEELSAAGADLTISDFKDQRLLSKFEHM